MTQLVIKPNATTANSLVLTGGATAHAVLSDNSDASYGSPAGTAGRFALCGLTDVSLPAGAITKALRADLRQSGSPAVNQWQLAVFGPSTVSFAQLFPGTTAITWLATNQVPYTISDTELDGLTVQVLALTGTGNAYEAWVVVIYVILPVVTVTNPTGTITTTNAPATKWNTVWDGDGAAPTHFEVKIYSAAQYGAGGFSPDTSTTTLSSGIIAQTQTGTADTWQMTTALANATYRAYVRVAQTVNGALHWSAWDFEGFTINVTAPSAPTLTATAQSSSGRIKLDLDDNGAVSADRFELQRTVDGGTTWEAVRIHEDYDLADNPGIIVPISVGAAVTFYDYEAPNGTATGYRARTLHNYSGSYAASAWTSTQTATWTSTSWWIKDPEAPALNLDLGATRLTSYADINRAARQGVFQALGATTPIVVSDTRAGPTGSITLTLLATTEQDDLNALLDSLDVLLLQGPATHGHPDRYVRFADHASSRAIDRSWSVTTRETLGWIEVSATGGAQTGAQYTP